MTRPELVLDPPGPGQRVHNWLDGIIGNDLRHCAMDHPEAESQGDAPKLELESSL